MENDTKSAIFEADYEKLKQQNEFLVQENKYLTEQILLLRQRMFGRSSEKMALLIPDNQLSLFNEAEVESAPAPEPTLEQITYTRKKAKGKREQDFSGLPVERVVHELPESEQVCPDCGNPLHVCGHDVVRRELTVIPAQYKVTEHVQAVYSCRDCEENAEATPMLKADVPKPVVEGSGIASPSLVAHIANQKYTLALPLYRQEQELKRNQINLSRQTMANWLIYVSEKWLLPIIMALKFQLLACTVAHADETSVQVLHEDGKPAESKSYMWLYRTSGDTSRHIILYDYQPNRKHENAKQYLEGFRGYLHSDAYGAYHNLPPGIIVSGCWSHVRRKFVDILKSLPDYNKPGSSAMHGKEYCDKLFKMEREYAKLPAVDNFKARHEARLKHTKPLMDEFFSWAEKELAKAMTSTMKSALKYALNERRRLENVLLDGRIEISNNRAERSIRPFALGRKNWLFSNTPKGAAASAMFYSIIETAKENGLKPYEYLKFIFEIAPNLGLATNPDSVKTLLPWNAPIWCYTSRQISDVAPWDEL